MMRWSRFDTDNLDVFSPHTTVNRQTAHRHTSSFSQRSPDNETTRTSSKTCKDFNVSKSKIPISDNRKAISDHVENIRPTVIHAWTALTANARQVVLLYNILRTNNIDQLNNTCVCSTIQHSFYKIFLTTEISTFHQKHLQGKRIHILHLKNYLAFQDELLLKVNARWSMHLYNHCYCINCFLCCTPLSLRTCLA